LRVCLQQVRKLTFVVAPTLDRKLAKMAKYF